MSAGKGVGAAIVGALLAGVPAFGTLSRCEISALIGGRANKQGFRHDVRLLNGIRGTSLRPISSLYVRPARDEAQPRN